MANEVASGGGDGSGVCYGRAVTPRRQVNHKCPTSPHSEKILSLSVWAIDWCSDPLEHNIPCG
ncbi:hypothetical protein E2C01_057283 [Portunus trituberculatus]|uniref:Uncharacterized protein n=1 Tax=Portunus trituberculatus TaxID=210409 RepID=A0A5B7GZW8_PORTR|nr:hypothetical protein [Portunus trituberculatus]